MNDQPSVNGMQPEPVSRREARRQRRAERLADPSSAGTWIAGLILIVLGILFLLQNTLNFSIPLKNWWALFILIPAVGALSTAVRTYHSAGGRLTAEAGGSLLVGLVLTFVTTVFLFGLSWSYFGPILIILTGVGILSRYLLSDQG